MPLLSGNRKNLSIFAALVIVTTLIAYFTTPFYSFLNPGDGIWTNINDGIYTSHVEKLQGIHGEVQILRDSYGVPHIYAQNEPDLYYAWGYVHAQDRLFQMDIFRRVAEGKLSEILGSSTYDSDFFYRSIRLGEYAQESFNALTPSYRNLLAAYSQGVNECINETLGNLPMEFKILGYTPTPWTPTDTLAIGKFFAWSLSADFNELDYAKLLNAFGNDTLQQLYPLHPPGGDVTIIPYGVTGSTLQSATQTSELTASNLQELKSLQPSIISLSNWLQQVQVPLIQSQGSNSWVVSGSRTASGKPFLANDPHLGLMTPSLWYEVHLIILPPNLPAQLNERGVSFPGAPAVILGHNEQVAWGMTVFPVAATDLYYYKWNQDQSSYYYQNSTGPAVLIRVNRTATIIRVKSGNTIENRTVTLNSTIHGPLLQEKGVNYAVRWTGQGVTEDLITFYKLGYAQSLTDFKNAVQYFQAAQQNFVYADTNGNIAYVGAGRVPVRRAGFGRIPVNGSVSTYEWTGYLPFTELPQIVNPSDGYIVTANNRPIISDTPFYASFYAEHYRAQRITELIKSLAVLLTSQNMRQIQTDTLSIEARDMVPYIINAVNDSLSLANATQLNVHKLAFILSQWNFHMDANLTAPTIFDAWLQHFSNDTWGLFYKRAKVDGPFPRTEILDSFTTSNSQFWVQNLSTSQTELTRDVVIRQAMLETLTDLQNRLGSNPGTWLWGQVHTYEMDHPLGSVLSWLSFPRLPANGGENTVNVASGLDVSTGPSFRQIVDFSNPVTLSLDIVPGGQSGFRFNPHWDDQLSLWQQGLYKPMTLPADPILIRDLESNITLIPISTKAPGS